MPFVFYCCSHGTIQPANSHCQRDYSPGARRTCRVWVFQTPRRNDLLHGRESLVISSPSIRESRGSTGTLHLTLATFQGLKELLKDEEGRGLFGSLDSFRIIVVKTSTTFWRKHDRSGLDESQAWWWRKWIDPTGEHSESLMSTLTSDLFLRRYVGTIFVSRR